MSARTSPISRTEPVRGPGPACLSFLALVLVTAMIPMPAMGQDGGTTGTPALQPIMGKTSYTAGETVVVIVKNTGDGAYSGDLNASARYVDGDSNDHQNATPWYTNEADVEIPAGGSVRFEWNQINRKTGEQAHRGTYLGILGWQAPSGYQTERAGNFELEPAGGATPAEEDTRPEVELYTPEHGKLVPSGQIRLRFVAESNDGLARVRVTDNGEHMFSTSTFQDPSRFEYDRVHTLSPGHHMIYVQAWDVDGDRAGDLHNVTVPRSADAEGSLRVTTSQLTYPAGATVQIRVTNVGVEAIEGTPQLRITNDAGATVWSPATAQVVSTLDPNGTDTFSWNQTHEEGHAVAPGSYNVYASWGQAAASASFTIEPIASTFDLRLLAPEPGSGQQERVAFSVDIGEPGARHVQLRITNGHANFTREQTFPEPVSGTVNRTVDLTGAPNGTYRAAVQARGPGGTAQAVTWFRLLPNQDTDRPELTLLHPSGDDRVPRLFPVVFSTEDDTGITYAEAYLDGQLVGRQTWPHPIQRGAFPARVPADMVGARDLRVVVYDTGENQDTATLSLTIGSQLPPCATVLAQAHAMAGNTTHQVDGVPTPAPTNASAEAGFSFPCPGTQDRAGDRHERGDFRYARSTHGLTDVQVRGHRIFEKVSFEDGDRAGLFAAMDLRTRGTFMVFEAEERGNVTWDINSTWVAFQRGEHVVLENTRDGSRVLLVMHQATPTVLGQRLTAELGPGAKVVVRPMSQGPVDEALTDSIVDGRIGAEVAIQGGGEPETVSYGDLQVVARQEQGRVTATLSTEQHQGRTVVLTLAENATLGDEVEVLLDGHPVEEADRLEDVLGAPDPNQPSQYYVVQDDGQTKVIVQVNHFSTRELVVQAADIAERFLGPLAILGGLALTVAAAAGLFRRQEI